jgi:hypothetical protein
MLYKYITFLWGLTLCSNIAFGQKKPVIDSLTKIIVTDSWSNGQAYMNVYEILPDTGKYILNQIPTEDQSKDSFIVHRIIPTETINNLTYKINHWNPDTLNLSLVGLSAAYFVANSKNLADSCAGYKRLNKKDREKFLQLICDSSQLIAVLKARVFSSHYDDYPLINITLITTNDTFEVSSIQQNFGMIPLSISNFWPTYDISVSRAIAELLPLARNRSRLRASPTAKSVVESLFYKYFRKH